MGSSLLSSLLVKDFGADVVSRLSPIVFQVKADPTRLLEKGERGNEICAAVRRDGAV
jgi:hypothetical protein